MIIKKLNKPAMTREYLKERIYWSITLLAVDLGIYAHIDNTTVGQVFWIIFTTVCEYFHLPQWVYLCYD